MECLCLSACAWHGIYFTRIKSHGPHGMSVCEERNPVGEGNDVAAPRGEKKKEKEKKKKNVRGESEQKAAKGSGGLNFQTVHRAWERRALWVAPARHDR